LLGASASGIRNILLITGDHPNKGNKPYAKMDIWDFDSVQAAWIARKLRDESVFLDGRKVQTPPSYFIGGASSPYASKPEYQAIRIEKKLNAGVQFFQTNLIFDLEKFEAYLEALERRNLLSRMHLIAGITIIRSINAAQYLRSLPGIVIPDAIMTRIENAKDAQEEGYKICLETLEKLIALSAIQGIHFMAINDFKALVHLITDGDLSNVRRR
jgi:methylenetetrahydrofolate reductase (NADPH)